MSSQSVAVRRPPACSVSPSHSGPARRAEDRQIVADARTGKLVAGDKRSGYGMTLDTVEAILDGGRRP
jgi:hypothetical protein